MTREIKALKDFVRYAKRNPISGPSPEVADTSSTPIVVYARLGSAWNRRLLISSGLSRRVPLEIINAATLVITALDDRACHDRHKMVSVNGVELCPVTAMLFLASAKNYIWSDCLEVAISKILEVSKDES